MKKVNMNIKDKFWSSKIEKICKDIIPYQYEVLNDKIEGIPKSHAIENFKIAAGISKGTFAGMLFQDSDVAKWIEAAAYSLAIYDNLEIEKNIDDVVEIMALAQQEDGYLNTFYTCAKPQERFTNIAHGHELYCAGHLLEAAAAYAEITGKEKFLNIMIRYIDYLMDIIGPGSGKMRIYPGHPEIEIALYKLYKYTNKDKYLQFMEYFIRERGKQPSFLERDSGYGEQYKDQWFALSYHQAHAPVLEQYEAVGHAVRAVYLYTAMADFAYERNDGRMKACLETLWDDVTRRKMYITGAIGSIEHGECFGQAYDLPNDRAYAETCATIGLIFWAKRMLRLEMNSKYSDVMELALYNGALSGMAADGKHYFYVNPLMMIPKEVNSRYDLRHVKAERVTWFGCACCPPNIARLITSLSDYVYDYNLEEKSLYLHLYISGSICVNSVSQEYFNIWGNYPEDGEMNYTYTGCGGKYSIYLRIPGWCKEWKIKVNGREMRYIPYNGYVKIERMWKEGDRVQIVFTLIPRLVYANPSVTADTGRAAIMKGPLVYCLEEADNGPELNAIVIDQFNKFEICQEDSLPSGNRIIKFHAYKEDIEAWGSELYAERERKYNQIQVKAIPYHDWGNRGLGEMLVWIRKNEINDLYTEC